MALTAFPTVRVNTASASADDAASGAGPATAITGTMLVSTNSTTISFSGTPDLSGVAEDGSDTVLIDGRGYVRISTRDDVAKTAVVETAISITAGTKFAIGGTIPSLNGSNARKLFAATAGPTTNFGMTGQWSISLESNDSFTSAVTLSATAGTGVMEIRSNTAGTRRTLTQTGNAVMFTSTTPGRLRFTDVVFRQSHATKSVVINMSSQSPFFIFENCIVGAADGTDCPLGVIVRSGGQATAVFDRTAVLRVTGIAINGNMTEVVLIGSEFSRGGGAALSPSGGVVRLYQSIISHNAGHGIISSGVILIAQSTIHGNAGDGIRNTLANILSSQFIVLSSQITGADGAYGINLAGTAPHQVACEGNNFGNGATANSSGAVLGFTLSASNLTLSPEYTDAAAAVRNFAVGTAMKATGYPPFAETIGAGQSGTFSFVDIGAAQREEPAAAGTPAFVAFG